MSKHTPGPWIVSAHEMGTFVRCAGGYIISGPVNQRPGHEANAHLIAAAPDLLEALLALNELQHGKHPLEINVMAAWALLDAAIAKATGGEA